MGARVIQGNVFDVLPTLPRGSVDAVCTSPPYWQLRSYLPKGHALKPLELGSEPTPAEFVANLVRMLRLVRDVMADHGTVWLNVGDTYSSGNSGETVRNSSGGVGRGHFPDGYQQKATQANPGRPPFPALPPGSLCLIPQRLAVALQDDGWICRSIIVWHKPACMPASLAGWMWKRCRVKVKASEAVGGFNVNTANRPNNLPSGCGTHFDHRKPTPAQWADCPGCSKCEPHDGYVLRRGSWRPTSSWEPVLMLAKKQGYYADGIAVQTPAAATTLGRNQYTRVLDDPDEQFAVKHDHETTGTTANLRDVWTIASEPLREAHYAAFPTELVHRCLKSATSARGYCPACGKPWARVVETAPDTRTPYRTVGVGPYSIESGRCDGNKQNKVLREDGKGGDLAQIQTRTLGWRQSCACPPAEPCPGLVLDPFAGSGRVGIECLRLGLDFVGCELNPEYAAMATRLFREESPLFAGVE